MRLEGRKMCLKKGIECEVVGNGRKRNAVKVEGEARRKGTVSWVKGI